MRRNRTSERSKPKDQVRNNRKRPDEKEPEAKGKTKYSSYNDPQWYAANGQLLKDTASFSYARRSGSIIEFTGTHLPDIPLYDPGIMNIYTVPSIGVSTSNTAAVNLAMRDVYSFVRHANSGHSNYDPVDLMIYFLAMDSIYTYWSWMTRLYGVLGTYSKTNGYVGDALITACGGKAADLREHYAEFRGYINQFAIEASRYAVPAIFSLFVRHSWMYSQVYRDSDTDRSQLYVYSPAFLYLYNAASAGKLEAYPVLWGVEHDTPDIATFEHIKNVGNQLLQNLATQEDIGIMSGDVLKAYGDDKLWKLSQLNEDYTVFPVYSEEVLEQIHNTDFVGVNIGKLVTSEGNTTFIRDWSALDITQNTSVGGGYLQFAPYVAFSKPIAYSKMLDFWKQEITPEMSMVASRNKVVAKIGTQDYGTRDVGQLVSCGSELCLCAYIWYYGVDGTLNYRPYWQTDSANTAIGDLSIYMRFNESPLRMQFGPSGAFNALIGEFDKFTILSVEELGRLHDCALLSMFNITDD